MIHPLIYAEIRHLSNNAIPSMPLYPVPLVPLFPLNIIYQNANSLKLCKVCIEKGDTP